MQDYVANDFELVHLNFFNVASFALSLIFLTK